MALALTTQAPAQGRYQPRRAPFQAPNLDTAIMGTGCQQGRIRTSRLGCTFLSRRRRGQGQMGDLVRLGKLEDEARRRSHRPQPGRAVLAGIAEDAPLIAAEARLGDIPFVTDDAQTLAAPESPEPDGVILGGSEDERFLLPGVRSRRDLHLVHRQVMMTEDLGLTRLQVPAHDLAIVIHRHQGASLGAKGGLAHRSPVDADLAAIPRDDPQFRQLAPVQVVDPDAVVGEGDGDPVTGRIKGGMIGRPAPRAAVRERDQPLSGEGGDHLGGAIEGGRHQPLPIGRKGQAADAAVMDRAIPKDHPRGHQAQNTEGGRAPLPMDQRQIAPAGIQGDGRAWTSTAGPGRRISRGGGQTPDALFTDPQRQHLLARTDQPEAMNRYFRSCQGPGEMIALTLESPEFGAPPGGWHRQALAIVAEGRRQRGRADGGRGID